MRPEPRAHRQPVGSPGHRESADVLGLVMGDVPQPFSTDPTASIADSPGPVGCDPKGSCNSQACPPIGEMTALGLRVALD